MSCGRGRGLAVDAMFRRPGSGAPVRSRSCDAGAWVSDWKAEFNGFEMAVLACQVSALGSSAIWTRKVCF